MAVIEALIEYMDSPLEDTSLAQPLVQLKRGSIQNAPGSACRSSGPFVDKFFLFGSVSGFLGMGFFGILVWMMRNSQINASTLYPIFRTLHIEIQEYLFLNSFIFGFLLQSTAKVYQAPIDQSRRCLLLIPVLLLGTLLRLISNYELGFIYFIGTTLLSLTYLYLIYWVVRCLKLGSNPARFWHSSLVIPGLTAGMMQPFFSLSSPSVTLIFFVLSTMPIILAASQQFIIAFIGGERLPRTGRLIVSLGYLLASGLLVLETFSESTSGRLSRASGVIIFLAILTYVIATRLLRAYRDIFSLPVKFAFFTGFFWLLIGSILLAIYSTIRADLVFHLWVTGCLVPLMAATSIQIVRFLTGKVRISDRWLINGLILWQLVPVVRALLPIWGDIGSFSIPVSLGALVFLSLWIASLRHSLVIRLPWSR